MEVLTVDFEGQRRSFRVLDDPLQLTRGQYRRMYIMGETWNVGGTQYGKVGSFLKPIMILDEEPVDEEPTTWAF